ncbi:hypothetical protein Ancab_015812 [Ancistrocladus abbreviatus]
MGKRGGGKTKGSNNAASGLHTSLSLREEASGRKQSHNIKSILKLQHLQNIASWASKEASVPSLAAFFGHQFAASGEALGIPPDPSLFPCQGCETILQPGFNCTVRIEKNRAKKWRRGKKITSSTENNVVYTCHFCSHRNVKRGTPKGHVREICPPKAKLPSEPERENYTIQKDAILEKGTASAGDVDKIDEIASPMISKSAAGDSPATPLASIGTTLLDSKSKRSKKSRAKKTAESEVSSVTTEVEKATGTSKKRKRKSWTTLKEIAQSSEHERSQKIQNISIPFVL